MGFSLAGFGAGLAESMADRIEEERKFSNLALQGRIERASVLKLQQEKQAKEMEDELRSRKAELVQYGVEDPDLQKAYLVSPVAFEALKKAKTSTDEDIRNISPDKLITVNKDKLSKLTGTADEFISNAVRSTAQVEPAKLLESQGRSSMFAPSAGSQSRRFEQLASARGLTLQDVARAESGAGPKMPEPVGAINFEAYPKKEKRPLTAAEMKDKALVAYHTSAEENGEDHPITNAAKAKVENIIVREKNLTPEQDKHAANMARAQAIMFDPSGKYSPEEKKWASGYLSNYAQWKKTTEASGQKNTLEPQKETAWINLFRGHAGFAVQSTFGRKKDWTLVDVVDPDTKKIIGKEAKYQGQIPQDVVNENILYIERTGIISAAMQSGYIGRDGTVSNPQARGAMSGFGIKFSGDKVLPPTKPSQDLTVEAKPTTAALPPASAAPAPAAPTRTPGPGRAGQGAPAAAPAAPRQLSAEDRQALEWANANPRDPRAAEIRRKLGM
jgi:hypothetical protein